MALLFKNNIPCASPVFSMVIW